MGFHELSHPLTVPFEPAWLEYHPAEPFLPLPPKTLPRDIIQRIDLTTLHGDDHDARIQALCAQARLPISDQPQIQVAAVCVFPEFVLNAHEFLSGSLVSIATVAGGFPHGLSLLESRVFDVRSCAQLPCHEIDVVMRHSLALGQNWPVLYDELIKIRLAAGSKKLKIILSSGELNRPEIIYSASMVALMAGADFLKTSTGKEAVNATLEAGTVMVQAIRSFAEKSGRIAGIKAAGGIRQYLQADQWYQLVYQRLGAEAVHPSRFRIGASSLLDDLVLMKHI